MLIFRAEHVPMILKLPGYPPKTATRRLWKTQRVKAGSVQKCYSICNCTGRLQPFANVHVSQVYPQIMLYMSPDQIAAEGYPGWTVDQFAEKFIEVNRLKRSILYVLSLVPYVVEFELEAP